MDRAGGIEARKFLISRRYRGNGSTGKLKNSPSREIEWGSPLLYLPSKLQDMKQIQLGSPSMSTSIVKFMMVTISVIPAPMEARSPTFRRVVHRPLYEYNRRRAMRNRSVR